MAADDKQKVMESVDSALKWLDANQTAEKDEFEHRLKEVEKVCAPIVTKLYQGGAAPPGGQPHSGGGGQQTGPTIDEVD